MRNFKLSLFVILVSITFVSLFKITVVDAACGPYTQAQLRTMQLAAADEWLIKTNFNLTFAFYVIDKYMPLEGSQTISNTGTFAPKLVVKEYLQLTFPTAPGQDPPVLLFANGRIIGAETYDNLGTSPAAPGRQLLERLTFPYINNFRMNFYGVPGNPNIPLSSLTVGVYNLIDLETLDMYLNLTTCQVQILHDFVNVEPYGAGVQAASGVAQTSSNALIGELCYLAMNNVTGSCINYPQYAGGYLECAGYWSRIPRNEEQNLCPTIFGNSRSVPCYLVHFSLTFVDPAVHCPHEGYNSVPCTDTCLSDCMPCALLADSVTDYNHIDPTTNAYCASDYQNIDQAHFKCQCKDSTISRNDLSPTPGRTYCQPITCNVDDDCPVVSGTATCVNHTCTPRPGFVWNATLAAFNARDMSQCPYGNGQVYTNGPQSQQGPSRWPFFKHTGYGNCNQNELKTCLKPGTCLPGPDPSTRYQCAPFGQNATNRYNLNQLTCSPLNSTDYGVPAYVQQQLGQRNYGCVPNLGFVGGYGYPILCQSPNRIRTLYNQTEICITPQQCLSNFDCYTTPAYEDTNEDDDDDDNEGSSVTQRVRCLTPRGQAIGTCQTY
jgi:hypothetical protein